ncbi:unnamed protein product [Caenorhabditis brenneri]
MSLSRPVRFPLLTLPYLCIESVFKSWDIFDIIFFALISQKTRRIVKILKIPMSGIQIFGSDPTRIWLGGFSKVWFFSEPSLKSSVDHNSGNTPLMLRNNSVPLYTSRTNHYLMSYTHQNTIAASKTVMEFLTEVFKCSVESVKINQDNIPVSGDIGVKSTVNLSIDQNSSQLFGYAQSKKLELFLENLEVTGDCWMINTKNDFYVDPKLFKCRKLVFTSGSNAWVTREILMQFGVPGLNFCDCSFSLEVILSFVTHWFHSDNKTLEYLYIGFRWPVSLDEFQTSELKLVPFSERNRVPLSESFRGIDFSKGLEIVRHDGLEATIHLTRGLFVFYIWHNQ